MMKPIEASSFCLKAEAIDAKVKVKAFTEKLLG